MSDLSRTNAALGDFSMLPAELRLEVFKGLLPDSFEQVYTVTEAGMVFAPDLSSPEPPFLRLNNMLRYEMLQAMKTDGVCKFRIDAETIKTNFLVLDKNQRTQFKISSCHLPKCEKLEMSIAIPSPRLLEDFMKVRRSVQLLVQALNNVSDSTTRNLSIRLEHPADEGCSSRGYNDFAMLMGPLLKLEKMFRFAKICRTTVPVPAPKVERQCVLMEEAITGREPARKLVTFQQLMLDIKLPLCQLMDPRRLTPGVVSHLAPGWRTTDLERASMERLLDSCRELEDWHKAYGGEAPRWLTSIKKELVAGKTPSGPLRLLAFDGRKTKDLKYWAAGLMTQSNPFWNELGGG